MSVAVAVWRLVRHIGTTTHGPAASSSALVPHRESHPPAWAAASDLPGRKPQPTLRRSTAPSPGWVCAGATRSDGEWLCRMGGAAVRRRCGDREANGVLPAAVGSVVGLAVGKPVGPVRWDVMVLDPAFHAHCWVAEHPGAGRIKKTLRRCPHTDAGRLHRTASPLHPRVPFASRQGVCVSSSPLARDSGWRLADARGEQHCPGTLRRRMPQCQQRAARLPQRAASDPTPGHGQAIVFSRLMAACGVVGRCRVRTTRPLMPRPRGPTPVRVSTCSAWPTSSPPSTTPSWYVLSTPLANDPSNPTITKQPIHPAA